MTVSTKGGQLQGIGGWLVFPTIGLFGIALYATMALLRDHVPTLRLIMEFGLPPLHRAWVLPFAYDTLLTLALLGGAIVLLVLSFRRGASSPRPWSGSSPCLRRPVSSQRSWC